MLSSPEGMELESLNVFLSSRRQTKDRKWPLVSQFTTMIISQFQKRRETKTSSYCGCKYCTKQFYKVSLLLCLFGLCIYTKPAQLRYQFSRETETKNEKDDEPLQGVIRRLCLKIWVCGLQHCARWRWRLAPEAAISAIQYLGTLKKFVNLQEHQENKTKVTSLYLFITSLFLHLG